MKKKHNTGIFTWPQFVSPQNQDVYNRKKALPYWLGLSLDDAILYMSYEMLSSSGHIRIGINALSHKSDKDKIMLFEGETALDEFQKELVDLYDVVYELMSILYFYERNRAKALKNPSSEGNQQTLPINKMEFPERFSKNYLDLLPGWYQQTPEKFLSIVLPLLEAKLSQLGKHIKKLHAESNISNFLFGQGELTLNIVTREMIRGFNIVNEEFFLLKSCASSHPG